VRIRAEVPLATAALPIRALPQAARIGVRLRACSVGQADMAVGGDVRPVILPLRDRRASRGAVDLRIPQSDPSF
jgi:hypothetical protein